MNHRKGKNVVVDEDSHDGGPRDNNPQHQSVKIASSLVPNPKIVCQKCSKDLTNLIYIN